MIIAKNTFGLDGNNISCGLRASTLFGTGLR